MPIHVHRSSLDPESRLFEVPSSSIYCVCKQRRLWQDCVDAQPSLFAYVVTFLHELALVGLSAKSM